MKIVIAILFVFLPLTSLQAEGLLNEQARQYRKEGYRNQSGGRMSQALSFYQKAVELDPFYFEVYNDIGVVYEKQGRLGEAEAYYQKALEINSGFMPAYTNLAFLYEKMGDIPKAVEHWKERYIRGRKGEYWHEIARQRLLELGGYPEIKRKKMEKAAIRLSRELVYQREQERLEVIEEAKLHFDLGRKAFQEGVYSDAISHLNTVLALEPADQDLNQRTEKMLEEAESLQRRQRALLNTKDALDYMEGADYLSAAERLQRALEEIFRITQKDFSLRSKQ